VEIRRRRPVRRLGDEGIRLEEQLKGVRAGPAAMVWRRVDPAMARHKGGRSSGVEARLMTTRDREQLDHDGDALPGVAQP
jgi:hypothetical protein